MKQLKGILLIGTILLFNSCYDETRPIVIDNSGNPTTEDPNDPQKGTTTCSFAGIEANYSSCLKELGESSLDVITWNWEQFPTNGSSTLSTLKSVITNVNADIIAVQEINSISEFNKLVSLIDGWSGTVVNVSGSLDLGYLYKTCEIEVLEAPAVGISTVEPRPAVKIKIKHMPTGMEVTLFNIHLKCCGSTGSTEANRREAASIAIQEYITKNLPDDKVIVLGDWNDDIFDGPFDNFLSDNNFAFADESIATGSSDYWSYPYSSYYLSHLDHILVSNELFNNFNQASTILLDDCVSSYESEISDHRGVMASFE